MKHNEIAFKPPNRDLQERQLSVRNRASYHVHAISGSAPWSIPIIRRSSFEWEGCPHFSQSKGPVAFGHRFPCAAAWIAALWSAFTEWLDLHWTKLSASNWTLIWGCCICLRLQQVGHELNMVEDVRGTLCGDAVAVWCRSSCCGFWDTPWYAHVRCFRCSLWFCFSPSIFVYRVYHRIFQSIPTNFIDCQFQS